MENLGSPRVFLYATQSLKVFSQTPNSESIDAMTSQNLLTMYTLIVDVMKPAMDEPGFQSDLKEFVTGLEPAAGFDR